MAILVIIIIDVRLRLDLNNGQFGKDNVYKFIDLQSIDLNLLYNNNFVDLVAR